MILNQTVFTEKQIQIELGQTTDFVYIKTVDLTGHLSPLIWHLVTSLILTNLD